MKKDYQTTAVPTDLVMPDAVTVAMGDLAETVREGLLALAVGAGLQVMQVMMQESVTAVCGPKGAHDHERTAVRHGSGEGSVTLGGRRVPVRRPRVRTADGSSEVPLAAYDLFSSTELLGEMALERMMAKLSTRRYSAGLEPVGAKVETSARSTSKSSVSRRFVAKTESALADMLAADLSGLDLVALMIDGVHFADHLCVVALGIGIDGTKHPLGVVEGDTENATVVKDLLAGLRERGLDTTRPILCVLDGAKALVAAVKAVFDHPVVARCQLHKISVYRPSPPVLRPLPEGPPMVLSGGGYSTPRRLPWALPWSESTKGTACPATAPSPSWRTAISPISGPEASRRRRSAAMPSTC